jgi:hypothetical protein
MNFIWSMIDTFWSTVQDVAPIVLLIAFFQIMVLKKSIPNLQRLTLGMLFVIIGLSFFLIGLEKALFPIGETMALQLSEPEFIANWNSGPIDWKSYYWMYLFAALIGFSTTIAEPSLIAVAIKANEVSGGIIGTKTLRIVVAIGVSFALTLGTYRIIVGDSLVWYIFAGYGVVLLQTIFVKKDFVALAYDSGGVTTSTVTVPIVVAIGIGLANQIEGRNPALDGFGLIAIINVYSIMSVLGYLQFMDILSRIKNRKR